MMRAYEHTINSSRWDVLPVPALNDNYMYLIIDRIGKKCAGVDAVEPEKLIEVAKREGCEFELLLTTHSHWDHDGGNEKFAASFPTVPIVGGKGDGVKAVTKEVTEKDALKLGENVTITVLETPFHTPAHVCYYIDYDGDRAVFTGDTLFVGGCGNLNTGSKDELLAAFKKLGDLAKDTKIYCGHEYTKSNFDYAMHIEPMNSKMHEKREWVLQKARGNEFTVPSTIGEEHETSPFMRAAFGLSHEILERTGSKDPAHNIYFVRRDKSSNTWKKL